MKGILVAVVGLIITSIGYQRATSNNDKFNQVVTSSGVATIYIAIGMSTLGLQTIPNELGALMCLIVSIGTMCIATRLNSQIVASFAVIGGYLPVFIIEAHDSISMRIWGVAELCTISMMSVYYILKNKWKTLKYVYYIISWCVVINATLWKSTGTDGLLTSSIVYITIKSVINTLIPVIKSYKSKEEICRHEFVLEIINSIIVSLCILQCEGSIEQYKLVAALIITSGVYIAGSSLTRSLSKYSSVLNILGVTMLTTICIIYKAEYINLVWVLEVVALLIISDKTENKVYLEAASVILMVTYIAHGVCSEGSFEFWSSYGKFVTEAIDIVLVAYLIKEYKAKGASNTSGMVQLAIGLSVVLSALICKDLDALVYRKAELVPDLVEKHSISSSSMWTSIVTAACIVAEGLKLSRINIKDSRIISVTEIVAAVFIGVAIGIEVMCIAIGLEGPLIATVKDTGAIGYVVCTVYLLLLVIQVVAYESIVLESIASLKHKDAADRNTNILVYFVTISMLIAFTSKSLYEVESTVWVSLILTIVGAVAVYRGVKTEYRAMRVSGIIIASISMIKAFIELYYISDNLRPIAYLIIALSCFMIGKSYLNVGKQSKGE